MFSSQNEIGGIDDEPTLTKPWAFGAPRASLLECNWKTQQPLHHLPMQ